jgi:predicted Fe-S protein YdhL (DUF1289 family)
MRDPGIPAGDGVPSPCTNVCRMHAASGWCEGCHRTLAEIAAWGAMADADKRALWQQLEQRRVSCSPNVLAVNKESP